MTQRDVGLRRSATRDPGNAPRGRSDGIPACAYMPATTKSVGDARRFVRSQLSGRLPDHDVDSSVLMVSELATNSVVHAGTRYCVRVWKLDDGYRIEVADDDGDPLPDPALHDWEALDGRGLALVADLATSWGWTPEPGGKAVWFEFGQPVITP